MLEQKSVIAQRRKTLEGVEDIANAGEKSEGRGRRSGAGERAVRVLV